MKNPLAELLGENFTDTGDNIFLFEPPAVYFRGDKARYTGKNEVVHGKLCYEAELLEALEPFARLWMVLEPLGVSPDRPLREVAPGAWPTVAACKRAADLLKADGYDFSWRK